MIDRDELVEAVSREVFARTNRGKPNDGWSGPDDWRIIEKITGFYIDAIEPRVREDEQERHGDNCGGVWDEWVANLRALLVTEAEVARTSPNGQHPEVTVMTHAAALLYAASLIEGE